MSRLIIKNLPEKITEDKLRSLFQEKGTVTDVQLKYTADGKFAQFAFVEFQLESEAEEAIEYFDSMCINTKIIQVERCVHLGDSTNPKAWSKYAPDSSAFKEAHPQTEVVEEREKSAKKEKKTEKEEALELLKKYKDDPSFKEFFQVHAPEESKKLHTIAQDQDSSESQNEAEKKSQANECDEVLDETENKLADEKINDLDDMKHVEKERTNIPLFTLRLKGLPYNCKKKHIAIFFQPEKPVSIKMSKKVCGVAYVGFRTEKHLRKGLLKNGSFIFGKRVSVSKYLARTEFEKSGESNDTIKKKWVSVKEALQNEDNIAKSCQIFVRNLAYTTTENDIEELFKQFGPLTEVNLPIEPASKKIKGFGTVTFLMPEHAVKAYVDLDGSALHGHMLHLLPGKVKAARSHNWNKPFLGHEKRESMGRGFVRNEVKTTKKMSDLTKQMGTTIMVRNIPFQANSKEIWELFSDFGEIKSFRLPRQMSIGEGSHRGFGFVDFLTSSDAKKAFDALSQNTQLYGQRLILDWAQAKGGVHDTRKRTAAHFRNAPVKTKFTKRF